VTVFRKIVIDGTSPFRWQALDKDSSPVCAVFLDAAEGFVLS